MSWKGSLVCKRCFENDPTCIALLKMVCSRNHSLNEPQVRVFWSGTERRLVAVEGNPPIRPVPKRSISGHQFILCDGLRCKGERCSFAHSWEEQAAWNDERKRIDSLNTFLVNTGAGVQAAVDVKRSVSARSQGDCSSLSHRDSTSYDEFSESESTCDNLVTDKEDERVEANRHTKQSWSANETRGLVLTKETYKQYHRRVLEEVKKNHAHLLKRCNGNYDLTLLEEIPKWIPKPKSTHVLYAYITGLTSFQTLFVTHDSHLETVCTLIKPSRNTVCRADIIRHISCNEEGEPHFTIALDKANSDKLTVTLKASDETGSTKNCTLQVYVEFKAKSFFFSHCWQQSVNHISDEIIERIIPEVDRFVPLQACVLTEEDKKVLKLKQCSDDQAEALKKIIALPPASPPLLITGAFGTGKTHALILAANYILQAPGREDTRVLVCCQSSTSADHFLDHYLSTHIRHQNSISIIRLTSFENPKMKYNYSISQFVSSLAEPTNGTKILVICTFHDSLMLARELEKQQQSLSFAYILMDEGAQAREAEAVAPLFMADESTRIVIAGDCQQIGPVSMLGASDPKSLLKRLLDLYPSIGNAANDYVLCLKTAKYGCHPEIIRFCAEHFYGLHAPTLFAPSNSEDEFPLRFVCTGVQQDEAFSADGIHEAGLALEQICQLHDMWQAGWGSKDLGQACFIASNKIEFGNLRDKIQSMDSREVMKIKLLTTSNIQGHEFRAVLVSTSEPIGSDGTPLCESRSIWSPLVLNTILSRAQSCVGVLGNPFRLMSMEQNMVSKYGERWRCWSHYLRVCLEHDTLTFDPSLKFRLEEQQQYKEILKGHLKGLKLQPIKDRIQICSVIQSIADEESALNQSLIVTQSVTPLDKSLVTGKKDHVPSPDGVLKGEEQGEEHAERYQESRLHQDYNEIFELGRGGYGIVYRAKHKVVHQFYAIKAIKLPSNIKGQETVLREAECLSQLSHKNIVRYYHSWKEEAPTGRSDSTWWDALQQLSSESYSCADKSSYGTGTSSEDSQSPSSGVNLSSGSGLSDARQYGCPTQDIYHRESVKSDSLVIFDHGESVVQQPVTRRLTVLFIQTELCNKTLKQWLEDTTDSRKRQKVVDYFEQMLDAVAYIHRERLIHRDLKPANIFLAANDVLKVGDFGLVTGAELQTQAPGDKNGDHSHTIGAGTKLYMSPEQKSNSKYNEKVDIYALGLIFFEMNCATGSYQERDEIFSALKESKMFPESFGKNEHPRERNIIQQMVQDNPKGRPSAVEIVSGKDFKRLKKVIRRTDACIKR